MTKKSEAETRELRRSLLRIVFQALITQESEVERSIIVSTYNQIEEQLFDKPLCFCNSTTMDNKKTS